jgi:glyoxylase-like metal-dependent hydrolase (beta-lactamase superfamily II)
MFFRPFYRFEAGCAAYVFGCGGQGLACVVDPHEGDVDQYVEFAKSKGMKITHVIDTHVHADHRSGARWITQMTGATYCLHRSADVSFKFSPLVDGQVIELGNTIIKVLHTPGHSPESIILLVSDLRRLRVWCGHERQTDQHDRVRAAVQPSADDGGAGVCR